MNRLRLISLLLIVACGSFTIAFFGRRRQLDTSTVRHPVAAAGDIPDSVRLASFGLFPGRQLVAYVLGGSGCGSCRKPGMRAAFASLRSALQANHSHEFQSFKIIGVAVDELPAGIAYLSGLGLQNFDEISTGEGWQNEQLVKLVWREKTVDAAAPQVVLIGRTMSATLPSMVQSYSRDSVILVVAGHQAIIDWVNNGTQFAPSQEHADSAAISSRKAGTPPHAMPRN